MVGVGGLVAFQVGPPFQMFLLITFEFRFAEPSFQVLQDLRTFLALCRKERYIQNGGCGRT